MSKNTYSEIRDDLKWVADTLEDNGFHEVAVYREGGQYNVTDRAGITQVFYPTSGTIVFYHGNDPKDRATYTLRNSSLDEFMQYLSDPEKIQKLFDS